MRERKVRDYVHERGVSTSPVDVFAPASPRARKIGERDHRKQAEQIRRHDLDKAAVSKVPQRRHLSAGKMRANVRIAQAKRAEEKEQLDAQKSGNRDEDERE